jgi:hypothetical protein
MICWVEEACAARLAMLRVLIAEESLARYPLDVLSSVSRQAGII